jgi:hypothetical protein
MAWAKAVVGLIVMAGVISSAGLRAASADDAAATAKELKQMQRELRRLEADRARDRKVIEQLQQKVDQMSGQSAELKAANAQLKVSSEQVKAEQTKTSQELTQIKGQIASEPSQRDFSEAFGRYLGSHTFDITGGAAAQFVYDQQPGSIAGLPHQSQNTFMFNWEPLFLYRPTDWIAFEGELEAAFGPDGTGVDLPLADFQLQLNDYMTLVAGLFDQPFGDWYESQSPLWVNRFITAPLPFGVEPVVPPGEMGAQLRGGVQWGAMGQDFDYTVWMGDGPSYSEPVAGAAVGSPTPVQFAQTNGKSYGGRLRFYPLPVDADWGRLELGASTYNGKWLDGSWYNAWGIDYNYFIGHLQTRGEWLQAYRNIPGGLSDNRQGWYFQAGYFLNSVKLPFAPPEVNRIVQRLEPLVRYSGVNQHFVAIDDVQGALTNAFTGGLIPDFGVSGSPALYAPHSREVAIGLDYWIAPSIVWQNEFDIELPEAGGTFVASDGTMTPVGAVPNDRAFLTQFAIGF